MTKSAVQMAVGRVAAASRKTYKGTPVEQRDGALDDARQGLLSAKLEQMIDRALNPDPPYLPLRDGERRRLAEKLSPDGNADPA